MLKRRLLEAFRTWVIPKGVWVAKAADASRAEALVRVISKARAHTRLCRFGGPGDGGYLMPDDVDGVAALISPGVSTVCDFDLAFADRGVDVFMADASVDGPPVSHPRFHFSKKFLDTFDSDATVTMESWLQSIGLLHSKSDLILQMDIERAEYRVLANVPDSILSRFRLIVIEFHDLDNIFSAFSADTILSTFQRLTNIFNIVHIHPNNNDPKFKIGDFEIYPTMEFTLYRKDRPVGAGPGETPHPLDVDCVPGKPTAILSGLWG